MRKIIRLFMPPLVWRNVVMIISATGLGLIFYLFYASNAVSYLSDDPKTCVNCHIMNPQFATWSHSSHDQSTNCNDCHVPHNHLINKYFFKAKDGIRHASMFTLRLEPQVIFIKDEGLKVVQENCKRCHEFLNQETSLLALKGDDHLKGNDKVCWSCHREVPHGRVNSLSSTPNATISFGGAVVADFITKETKIEKKNKN